MKKFFLASDHAGYYLKDIIKKHLENNDSYEVIDLGANNCDDPISYALQGIKLGKQVIDNSNSIGIGICGTGIGISIAVNKISGIRGARITSIEDAQMAKKHNNANVITLGGRQLSSELAIKMIDEFNETEFEGGRHAERIQQLDI